jgi:hypothetical protein
MFLFGTNYPILDIFWTMLEFFMFFIWIYLLFFIFTDIFRNHEMKGWHKAAWVILIIITPFLGSFVYLIVHGGQMHERAERAARAQQKAFDSYVQRASTGQSTADQLHKLAELKDKGVLTEDEFAAEKAKLLV